MTAADIAARVHRLDQLGRGLMKEICQIEKADDPMLYLERRAYLTDLFGGSGSTLIAAELTGRCGESRLHLERGLISLPRPGRQGSRPADQGGRSPVRSGAW
jgi:hypothetical protein